MRKNLWMPLFLLGVLLLVLAGCNQAAGKKAAEEKKKPVFSSGTCAVCKKQSSTLIDFHVPNGTDIKLCSADCAKKVMADPKQFGGSPVSVKGSDRASSKSSTPVTPSEQVKATNVTTGPPAGAPPPGTAFDPTANKH